MIGFSFLKVRKPKQFEYRPRYYDPEAEQREQRKKAILGEDYRDNYEKNGEKEYKPGQYVSEMRFRRGVIADRRDQRKKSTVLRIIIFLVLLLATAAWLLSSTQLLS